MATLTITQSGTTDFRGGPVEANIDQIVFQTPGPGSARAAFEPAQFGAGLISNSLQITGDSFVNVIDIRFEVAGSFSAAGWTFLNWTDIGAVTVDDVVQIIGTSANQNITGSSQDDTIDGRDGVDQIDGGGGDDDILIRAASIAVGSVFDGGAHSAGGGDSISLGGQLSFDLRPAAISGVEILEVDANVQSATVNGNQIGGSDGIGEVKADPNATLSLLVRDDSVNLSGVTFADWGADDTISVQGTSTIANTLVGSNQKDTISGTFTSFDTITGGNGADTLIGGGGNDSFAYVSAGDVDAGETINGGAGTDRINLSNAGASNFSLATIIDVETLDFVTGSSIATLASNQLGPGEIVTVSGSSFTDQLVVTTADQFTDLSGLIFEIWSNGSDSVTILGSTLGDLVVGSGQNDTVKGLSGTDFMDGAAGIDTADYSDKTTAVVATLNGATNTIVTVGGVNEDSIRNFENVVGGSAADTLTGDGLANRLSGSEGNDILKGAGGADTLDGGSGGGDIADYRDKTASVVVTLNGAVSATVTVGGIAEDSLQNIESVLGGSAADTLTGDGSANLFRGGGGADVLNGAGGADTAQYAEKTTALVVTLNGATNATVTVNGVAEDTIKNIENVHGGTAADTLTGDSLANVLRGGGGADALNGGGGTDTADYADKSAAVAVTLNGATNATVTVGGAAEDTIKNFENVTGGTAGDSLTGDSLANVLSGGGGDDSLKGAGGADTLDGGSGAGDRADYSDKTAAVVVTLNGATNATVTVGGAAEDTIKNIENVIGGSAADTLTGDGLANLLSGGGGADTLAGLSGNDRLEGGAASDLYKVGAASGSDTLFDTGGTGDNLRVTSLDDIASSTRIGDDLLIILDDASLVIIEDHFIAANTIETASDADESVVLATGTIGGDGNGIISGTTGSDHLDGKGGDDLLFGDAGNDVLFGSDGDDRLSGGSEKDVLFGGSGDDSLSGGADRDILIGDGGQDAFQLASGDGPDLIVDFTSGSDVIALDAESFGIAPDASVEDVVKIGGAKPTDGAQFHVQRGVIYFSEDWGETGSVETLATVTSFAAHDPSIADFALV